MLCHVVLCCFVILLFHKVMFDVVSGCLNHHFSSSSSSSASSYLRSSDPLADTASSLGNAMDELMRHQPSVRTDAIKAIIQLLENIRTLGTHPQYVAQKSSSSSSHAGRLGGGGVAAGVPGVAEGAAALLGARPGEARANNVRASGSTHHGRGRRFGFYLLGYTNTRTHTNSNTSAYTHTHTHTHTHNEPQPSPGRILYGIPSFPLSLMRRCCEGTLQPFRERQILQSYY